MKKALALASAAFSVTAMTLLSVGLPQLLAILGAIVLGNFHGAGTLNIDVGVIAFVAALVFLVSNSPGFAVPVSFFSAFLMVL